MWPKPCSPSPPPTTWKKCRYIFGLQYFNKFNGNGFLCVFTFTCCVRPSWAFSKWKIFWFEEIFLEHFIDKCLLSLLVFLEFLLFSCEPPEPVFWFFISHFLFLISICLLVVTFLLPFVVQPSPTLCNPTDCSPPGFPVLHHLPELAQTHVHWVSDAIQPSHPLLSASPPAFNLFQH